MTTTTDVTAPRHWPTLVPVHGGWRAACSCGWQHPTTLPTERRARRLAWEHIGQQEES